MVPSLIFDIETIPDVLGLRRLYDLPLDTPDEEVAEIAFTERRAKNGSDFLPHYLQRIVAISCALRVGDGEKSKLKIWSLAEPELSEKDIIQRFFDGIAKYTPQLVSWNGGGFDLPVLHYRGLIHGVNASRYWDLGDGDFGDSREFKWNNYISRYHTRHLDLMDLLAMYQPRANAPLDDLAKLIGYPGKLGMDGSKVWEAFLAGKTREIADYCETDVMNTYLVLLRFRQMRGEIHPEEYEEEIRLAKETVQNLGKKHWDEFLAAWQ